MRFGGSVDALVFGAVLKLIVVKDLRERLCLVPGEDAGQSGDSFGGLASCELFVDGVSDGTQNEGRVGFADCIGL